MPIYFIHNACIVFTCRAQGCIKFLYQSDVQDFVHFTLLTKVLCPSFQLTNVTKVLRTTCPTLTTI